MFLQVGEGRHHLGKRQAVVIQMERRETNYVSKKMQQMRKVSTLDYVTKGKKRGTKKGRTDITTVAEWTYSDAKDNSLLL